MGIVTSGIPQGVTAGLAKEAGVRAFVETGTFQGNTTRWALTQFNPVYTVERAEGLFRTHSPELLALGIKALLGDSRDVLPRILAELGDQGAVFWLDGHWSSGETAGAGDECPLLDELRLIVARKVRKDIVMIDDARLYLSAPPRLHNAEQWPTIGEISLALSEGGQLPYIQVLNDVIFAVWDEQAKIYLTHYAQFLASGK